MYSFVDQPAGLLCKTGRLLLWSMRAWSLARDRGTCAPVMLRRAFMEWDILPVLGHFDIAMALLRTGGGGGLSIAPLQHPLIEEDEAILLGLWGNMRAHDSDHLHGAVALLIGDALAVPLCAAMAAFTAGLEKAGHEFVGMTTASASH